METTKFLLHKLFLELPLVGWCFIGITIWIVSGSFWKASLLFLIGGILFIVKVKNDYKKVAESKREDLIQEAKNFVELIKKEKKLTPISSSLFLDKEEVAFLEDEVALFETRAVRRSVGAGTGLRVAKGVYIGGYGSQAESHQEMRALDSGNLILTNKKMIFRGAKENRTILLSKIIEMQVYSDAIGIASTGRQKSSNFSVENPYKWKLVMYILKNVDDPLNFKNIENIDIQIAP